MLLAMIWASRKLMSKNFDSRWSVLNPQWKRYLSHILSVKKNEWNMFMIDLN